MLHIQLQQSALNTNLRWSVDVEFEAGICHRLLAPNGAGKTTFLEELKIHWHKSFPGTALGFADQAPLAPWQNLSVETVMDLLWDVTPERHHSDDWRNLEWWQASDVTRWWARPVSQLSGGENQWVKILMMRSLKCEAWILDEPFQSLDVDRQLELWQLLQKWLDDGRYLILVHHGSIELRPLINWKLIADKSGHRWEKSP